MAMTDMFGNPVNLGGGSTWTVEAPAKTRVNYYTLPRGSKTEDYHVARGQWWDAGYELDPETGKIFKQGAAPQPTNYGQVAGNPSTIGTMFGGFSSSGGANGAGYTPQGQTIDMSNRFEPGLAANEVRLSSLLTDPSSIKNTAAYNFRFNQGLDALNRQLGARGLLNSGNRLTETTKYGQDMASQEYDSQFNRLKDLVGQYSASWIGDKGQNIARERNLSSAAVDRENAITSRLDAENRARIGNLSETKYNNEWVQSQKESKQLRDLAQAQEDQRAQQEQINAWNAWDAQNQQTLRKMDIDNSWEYQYTDGATGSRMYRNSVTGQSEWR